MTCERIVVGVDGSPGGSRALQWAVDLAVAAGCSVVAVHALGLLDRIGDDDRVPSQRHRTEIEACFTTEWCEPLANAGITTTRVLRDGNPVDVLLAVAEEESGDLIVVGSRGTGSFPERLLGSTSSQLAQRSTRPVVIVPASPPLA